MSTGPETQDASPPGSIQTARASVGAWRARLADRLRVLARKKRARAAGAFALLLFLSLAGTGWDFRDVPTAGAEVSVSPPPRPASREATRLVAERERLATALRRKVPRGSWIVIDQTHNRLRLMRGDETVLEAPCSAGSGMVLKEGSGGRVWVFDTPRGRFEVLSKLEKPVWRKPDWAFVEEGSRSRRTRATGSSTGRSASTPSTSATAT